MAKQKLVKKGDQYGILDVASNTVMPISSNMKLVQKQGRYGILDGDSVIPIDEFSQTIGSRDLDILKKKVSTESVSTPTPQVTPSVSPKTPPVTPSASPAPIPVQQPAEAKPIEQPVEGSQGKLLIPQKPFYEFNLPPAQQQMAPAPTPAKVTPKQPVIAPQEEIVGSQGKLLIPEPTQKFPAVTETVTTYKNVPVTAPSKNTKNVPLNPELMLQAIAKNEGGKLGVKTAIKGKGTRNTASGTYQITEGTLENIYNKDVDFKKSYDNFQQFKKEFNSNPEVEHQAALSHMADLIKQFGIHALTAWYSPDHAARAASGSKSALKEVPRRDAGNTISAGKYFNNAFANYKNLLGMQPEQAKTARIPVKQEVIKEPAVEVPSFKKFDVTNPNYYNARGEAYPQVQEIGYMEDLWNRLKGTGAKALAGVLSEPALARTYAEDIVFAASGLDEDFNKLPAQAKKEVLNTVRTIQANGDLNTAAAVQSQKSFDYLNKKADKIYERTIKQEGDIFTDISNFKDNPSADSALSIVNRGVRSLVESIPYMATAILPGGNITQGIASAGSKRLEDLNKDGNVGLGYMLASGAHGAAEGFFEAKTNAILKKAGTILRGNTKAVEEFSKGIIKSILKDFNEEGLSEGATTIVQELADKINKGDEINIGEIFRKAADSYFLGGFAGGGITATAGGIRKAVDGSIAAKTYVANKIMPSADRKKYDSNVATIQNLNTQKSEDSSPEVNQIIDNKIQELAAENETLFKSTVDVVDNLSNEQMSQVFNIDDQLERNYNDAKTIIDDTTMDDSAKTLLLNDLLKKQNELKQQRDAIQKQTTSEVPIQPETGASVQMAQGEPKPEPQVPTEEVKAEETVKPTINPTVAKQMQTQFGLDETQANAASVVIDKIAGTIAERTGKTKEEVLNNISFEKATEQPVATSEEVTAERPVEKTEKKVEGPINTEVKFDDAIANQVVAWNEFPEQNKGKEIASRNQTLTNAANDLLNGKISNEEYRAIVEKESPIKPIETFFNPSTEQEIKGSLEAPKVPLVNSVTAKGETFVDPKTNQKFEIVSDKVGLRLDLPAYLNNNKWVVTIHADAKDTKTGKVTKDKPVSYTGAAKITGVTFDYNPNLASKIAKGESSRETKFKMRGTLVPIAGTTVDEQNANAKKELDSIKNNPAWVQIGANPFRHSYFYNRSTGKPILSADEVIQIGGLVYAKNVVEANWNDEKFQVTQKGKPVLGKDGKPIFFQGNKGSVSLGEDGKFIITALTNPNVSTPLHEMAHVYEHYLEDKEKQIVLKWTGQTNWNRNTSEKFANGFEKYLAEGKAPSKELEGVFNKFKEWLLDIYNGITSSAIDIQLNDDMRKIYDIMLSGKETEQKTTAEPISQQKQTEQITAAEPISSQQKTEQTNAVQKGIDAVNKALKRGRPRKEAVQGGIAFMQKTIAYEEADDTTREQMVRDINKKFGVREKKAPTAQKITGQPAPNKVTVQEMAALKDQIKLEARAAREGAKFVSDLRKSVIAQVKAFITRGKMSVGQQKSLLNGLQNLNLFNPVMRERFFDRMQKMFDRIDYKDRLDEANKFRKQIKKLAKSDTLQDSVRIMAKDFAKIIPDFTNIDSFIEKAKEVFNAIKTPGMKGEKLSLREAAVIQDINNFTKKTLKAQDEKVKNTLLDEYDYLVEAGLIDGEMSLQEIQNYIMDVESGAKQLTPDKEAEIRERVGALFNSMAGIVNGILETGENPLTGEEVELDSYTRNLIKNFAKMDLSQLNIQELYRATEALENYLVNGIIDNMESMYQIYNGALESKKLADDGVMAHNLKRFGLFGRSNIFARTWAVNISPIKSILDLMFRSREIGSKVFNATGLRDIANASSLVKNMVEKINKAYQDRFSKTKPNKEAFDSAKNTYQRGIYAHLKRSLVGTDEEVQVEFDRRKKQIQDTIDALEKSQDKNLIKKAQIYKEIFDSIKDAENIEEVEKKIDPINMDAVKWRTAIFEKYYPEVKQVAASVYNTILEDDINYSPDVYEKIIEDGEPDVDQKASYKMSFNYLNTEKAGTLMKNNRLKSLPQNRVINFDFDYNNSNALAKMLTDIKTAPYVQKYKGFTNSKSFEKIFPDIKDRNVIKERMNWYVNEVRSKNISTASSRTADAAKIFRALSRYGTSRALGGVTSFVKQSIPAIINTTVNLVNNPVALAKGIATMSNRDAQKFISNSGYGIANRGLESQTAIESADQMLEKTDVNSIDKISEAIGKAGKVYLDNFLKSGDVLAARASWMAYYINKLDQMKENTSNIDWATHKLNKEAADYAEDKVNLQQNVSDTDMLGKLLNTKNPGVTIARSILIPFSSFIFNAKDKISTDLTILSSNANKQEKVNAMKSLAGSAAEMLVFEAMSAAISSAIITTAYSILGYDEDDDEKEARRNKYMNMAGTRLLTDAIAPIPNWGDKALVAIVNKILNYTQQDLDEEDKKLLYEYKPQDQMDAILGLIGGVPEIAIKPATDITSTIQMISSDAYYDKFGNEIYFSPEEKDKLKFVLATEVLGLTNALPNEVLRLNQKVKDTVVKEAK